MVVHSNNRAFGFYACLIVFTTVSPIDHHSTRTSGNVRTPSIRHNGASNETRRTSKARSQVHLLTIQEDTSQTKKAAVVSNAISLCPSLVSTLTDTQITAQRPSLLNLPLELRTLMLECLLRRSSPMPIGQGYPREPPVSLACKQLRNETLPIFYNSNIFNLYVDSYDIKPLRFMNKQWVKYRTRELRSKYNLPYDEHGILIHTGYPNWSNLARRVLAARKDHARVFETPTGVSDLESHAISALMDTVGARMKGASKQQVQDVLYCFRAVLGAIDPRWNE